MLLAVLSLSIGMSACQRKEPDKAAPPSAEAPVAANGAAAPAPPPVAVEPAPAMPAAGETVTPATGGYGATPTTGASKARATNRSPQQPILRAVRIGKHPGVDRLVFEFNSAGLPAWEAEYVERPVRDCGSGDPVPVKGDAWLQIRFTGAQAHSERGTSTSGPRRRPLPQTIARELVRTCDFEGEVTWVIGVTRPNTYAARVMDKPSRLVIDISH